MLPAEPPEPEGGQARRAKTPGELLAQLVDDRDPDRAPRDTGSDLERRHRQHGPVEFGRVAHDRDRVPVRALDDPPHLSLGTRSAAALDFVSPQRLDARYGDEISLTRLPIEPGGEGRIGRGEGPHAKPSVRLRSRE